MEKTILQRGEVKSLQLKAGITLRCESGVLWLTFPGEKADVFLRRGESWVAPRRGLAVVQAMETGAFRQSGNGRSNSPLFGGWHHWPKPLTLKH